MLSIKDIGRVGKRYRHLRRYQQIIGIILKYGFDNIIHAMNIDQYIESGLQLIPFVTPNEKVERFTTEQRIRMALEELGPTFIKMGQVLSSRPDLIPVKLLKELAKLQNHVPAFAFSHVQSIIEAEFGQPWDTVFVSIEKQPFASASIGQVHQATTPDGRKAAVKIQRPGIRKTIETDLEIIHHLAGIMEKNIEEAAFFKPVRIIEEFAKRLEKELDYTIEAANMEQVAQQFKSDRSIHIPEIMDAETSPKVLTMEYIEGIKADDITALNAAGIDLPRVTVKGADFIMKQVFEFGFFHADPHPGNIFILPDNRICPVDFGMVGFVDTNTRESFVDLIHAIGTNDLRQAALTLCEVTEYDLQPQLNRLEKDLSYFVTVHLSKTLKDIHTPDMVNELMDICANHKLRIPPDFFLMLKAFIAIEGVAKRLNPDFDMIAHAVPYVKTAKLKKLEPARIAKEIMGIARESFKLVQNLPSDAVEIIKLTKSGNLKLNINVSGLDKILNTQDQTSNRISFSIIIAALILGSAIVLNSKIPPLIFGVSVIGIGGFIAAAVMGIWLLVAIIQRGRL